MSSSRPKPIGVYVPPAKRVKTEKFDRGSDEHQRIEWDENKKKITRIINKANFSNIKVIAKELFQCNLIRYKGLFARALIRAQERDFDRTDVYATLLAIVNSRIRSIGMLVVNRLILDYRKSVATKNRTKCSTLASFIAHLLNQDVVHVELGFQMLKQLLRRPSATYIEISVTFLKECGAKLELEDSTRLFDIFKMLRDLALENDFDNRTHELIDMVHIIRKDKFRDYQPVKPELNLVDEDDRITHEIELDDPQDKDYLTECNYYKFDLKYVENEKKYDDFKKTLLEEDSGGDSDSEYETGESNLGSDHEGNNDAESRTKPENADADVKPIANQEIIDETGKDYTDFRRKIYLTFKSSIRHDEVVHKLMKARIEPELHNELCQMILDCCGQGRTYESIYGLVASKLCQLRRREFAPLFERIFELFYETVHRFETNKIRNVAKFYANLFTTESIDWRCLNCLKLRENATTSAGRCFIKFLFEELVALLSLDVLLEIIRDPKKEHAFKELFPKEPEQDTRFAINFFTCSQLGKLTEDLRKELPTR